MITKKFIVQCSKQVKELAKRVLLVSKPTYFNTELRSSDFMDSYPDAKLSSLIEWSNQTSGCKFIYAVSKSGGIDEEDLFKLYKEAKKREKDSNGKRAFARANKENRKSRILYVGSSNSLETRIRQHLGHKDDTLFSMQLKHWLKEDSIDLLKFEVWKFEKITPQDALQVIEDSLWEKLQPMLGKKGGK